MRSLVQVYALTVCFCSLMCFVIALGIGGYDMVEVAAPELTLPTYPYGAAGGTFPDGKSPSPDEIIAAEAEQRRLAIRHQTQSALQSLIFIGIVCAIDVVVFAIHWRLARREERRVAATTMARGAL